MPAPLAQLPLTTLSPRPAARPPVVLRLAVEVAPPARLAPPPTGVAQAGWVDADGTWWVGRGEAAAWTATDEDGGPAVLDRVRSALADAGPEAAGMRAFGALAFDPARAVDPLGANVPIARFALPRWLLRIPADAVERGGMAEAWVALPEGAPASGARLDAELAALRAWAAEVAEPLPVPPALSAPDGDAAADHGAAVVAGLAAIHGGDVEKVVLARPRYLEAAAHFPAWTLFASLAERAPGTARFALLEHDGAAFIGASPERLFALEGDRLAVDVLAGTAARGVGEAVDVARADALRASAKDAHEHAVVREAVMAALAPLATDLVAPATPVLLPLPTVWHLHTPVVGRLAPGAGLGDLVRALHPTPAVGGAPRQAAIELIRSLEPTGRGRYAGPVGWVSAGAAHLAVGIRSAHLRGNRAAAMAGGGIVAGSEPAAEWAETERKLAPMLAALSGGAVPEEAAQADVRACIPGARP